MRVWAIWAVISLCACSAAVTVPEEHSAVVVIRPNGYRPVDLTTEELQQGMRRLYANGPLPGLPKGRAPRFLLASASAIELARAAGYLEHCQRLTGQRGDCWEDLNASGGLDDEGATYVALHFALGEALESAAAAVGSMTPTQVRAMMGLMFLGMIAELLSPEPVSKALFVLTATNLIAYVGVDVFNHVVKGFTAMLEELARAQDFASIRAAGVRYGQRIGPTVGRIVVMVATYGVAKFAGLFKGSILELPGGSRAAALAEAQGFRPAELAGARSIAIGADGSVAIGLGMTTAMSVGTGSAPRNEAFERARAGGAHSGTLRNYEGRSTAEIRKAIQSYERQVELHKQKLANPSQYAEDWERMTPEGRAGLLKHWQEDIQRNQDLANVLRGLLETR